MLDARSLAYYYGVFLVVGLVTALAFRIFRIFWSLSAGLELVVSAGASSAGSSLGRNLARRLADVWFSRSLFAVQDNLSTWVEAVPSALRLAKLLRVF